MGYEIERYTAYGKGGKTDDKVDVGQKNELNAPTKVLESSGYRLNLTNSIGTTFDSKHVDMEIKFASMSNNNVVVATSSAFFVWQFKNFKIFSSIEIGSKNKSGTENCLIILSRLLHVDDVASGVGGENIDWKRLCSVFFVSLSLESCFCVGTDQFVNVSHAVSHP
ncbi:hypothetical protein HELRODRAFT_179119 [Helobdella robusta]|uniref:IFT121 second beta-propeller domain-containing protein n=1 Tax=Helobdella robusta TaxID=6412 RepID=T1FE69_HELRO|nr:hypothetical protein HELRODRAFT_179119 [Helobdella robusta]ESN95649.1 hypothetical protein HELRODRAFT_179119 [Helobdella robusta]